MTGRSDIVNVECNAWRSGWIERQHRWIEWVFLRLFIFLYVDFWCLEDLDRAQWAEIPRDAYLAAAKYLVAHNVAYRHLHVDDAQAWAQFVEVGGSCAAIRSQATAVDVTGTMPMKLSGPADVGVDQDPAASGCAEPASEAEVEGDDVADMGGIGHEHVLEGEDMPGLRCVAGEVGSDDLDVERVLKEFAAKLKLLMSRRGSSGGQTFDQDMDSFRRLAESMSAAQLQEKLNKLVAQMDHAEGGHVSVDGRKSVQVVHTGNCSFEHVQSRILAEMFPGDVSLWRWCLWHCSWYPFDFQRMGRIFVWACRIRIWGGCRWRGEWRHWMRHWWPRWKCWSSNEPLPTSCNTAVGGRVEFSVRCMWHLEEDGDGAPGVRACETQKVQAIFASSFAVHIGALAGGCSCAWGECKSGWCDEVISGGCQHSRCIVPASFLLIWSGRHGWS